MSGGLGTLQRLAAQGVTFGGGALPKATCTSTGNAVADVQLSCDNLTSPEDETPVVVDPTDPNHLLAGSNDYYFVPTGSSLQARVPTGFFVSFDGGNTWTDGQIPMGSGSGNGGNGDPSPAFNRKFATAHMAQLNVTCGTGPYCGTVSVAVATSRDGGRTWGNPVVVAQARGRSLPVRRACSTTSRG